MPDLDMSFEWPVDTAGYEIVPLEKPKKPKKPAARRARNLRNPGYPPSGRTIIDAIKSSGMLKRLGGPLRMVRPLDQSLLFMEFGHLDGSDGSIIGFANHFGYLSRFGADSGSEDGGGRDGESVSGWGDEIDRMQTNVEAWQSHQPAPFVPVEEMHMTNLKVSLVPVDGRAVLRIRPNSLFSAMQLQFAHAMSTGADIRSCDHCGKLFEIGGRGRRTRKARFCLDSCRSDYHVARRK